MLEFSFTHALLNWFDEHGRHDLPWQVDDPYKVWVSEIMLQQTQVKTVLNYFDRFVTRFPTVHDLAEASWEDVAPYWAGLGYYARARNLHKSAILIHQQGRFPHTLEQWIALPGIGRSTAGAIMSLGLRQFGVILDGNVKRVLARFYAIQEDLSKPLHERKLWQLAEQLSPQQRNHDYTQAIMDLGATICTPKNPLCLYCPMQVACQAYLQGMEHELPFKKSKKIIPTKTADIVLLNSDGQWFWQQRDLNGIWGGLWCLPILENTDDETKLSEWTDTFDLNPTPKNIIISHSFSHFKWQLNLKMFHVKQKYQNSISSHLQGTWLSPEQAVQRGIPSAMKKLILAISS